MCCWYRCRWCSEERKHWWWPWLQSSQSACSAALLIPGGRELPEYHCKIIIIIYQHCIITPPDNNDIRAVPPIVRHTDSIRPATQRPPLLLPTDDWCSPQQQDGRQAKPTWRLLNTSVLLSGIQLLLTPSQAEASKLQLKAKSKVFPTK